MLIGGWISEGIVNFLLNLDAMIYNLIRYIYNIFLYLAKLNLFETSDYIEIVNRIYVVLGVVMLFILAYSLLKAVINPDDFSKGDSAVPSIIKNLVISLVIIVILPTVFTVAFNIQAAVLNNDFIGKLILGEAGETWETKENGGNTIAVATFKAFFHPNEDKCEGLSPDECLEKVSENCNFLCLNHWDGREMKLKDAFDEIEKGASFSVLTNFSSAADDREINYNYIISTIVGLVLCVMLLSYCVDMGIRVVKLIFYQLIAPIPVICRVIPGKKKVFDEWVKQTVGTFIDVFIKVAIMYLGVYVIELVVNKLINNPQSVPGFTQLGITTRMFVVVFLILGIVLFIKEAPKLLKDIFGIDLGGGSFKRMLGLGAAGIAGFGGLFTTGARNMFGAVAQGQKDGLSKGRIAWNAARSAVAGGASGAARSAWAARKAKGFGDIKNAASKGTKAATDAKGKRAAYKASHGGTVGALSGHAEDTIGSVREFLGMDSGIEYLKAEQAVYQEGMGFKKELFDLVSDNEMVMAYQGLKTSAQEKNMADLTKDLKLNSRGEVYNKLNGQILKDKEGNVFRNAEAAAVFLKSQEIEKYDTAIKLASMKAIHDKLVSGDGRFTAQFEKFKIFQEQHSDNKLVADLEMRDLTASELQNISNALNTNDLAAIDSAKKMLESTKGSILANDKQFKIASGDVQVEISKKIEEKKKEGK